MQSTPETSLLSYYQIAGKNHPPLWRTQVLRISIGIHGRPYTTWDNVGPGVDTPLTGYCTHGECRTSQKSRRA